ncbi:MAG: hypothetical protein MJ124_00800 [Lachnospiraceae bacterium]|nr:hypothetical protein [Lachnospiraceae bacterium]
MKKYIIMIMCVILTMFTGCGKTNNIGKLNVDTIIRRDVEAKIVAYDNLSDMEKSSDAIIKVIKSDKECPVISRYGKEFVSGFTFSYVIVKEIYKDNTESIINGDVIRILENEVYDEQFETVYHIAGYEKMVEGCEYILLVEKNTYTDGDTYYTPLGVHYGVVSLEDDGRYVDVTQKHSSRFNMALFEAIWDEIRQRYND